MLNDNQISLTTAVKSLHPTEPGWNRRFMPKSPEIDSSETSKDSTQVDPKALPPLHQAAYGGHSAGARRLIEAGADVNAKGPNGWTPLHMAAMGGHRILSEILLDAGADIRARDEQRRTPAKLADIHGHAGMAKFLRDRQSRDK